MVVHIEIGTGNAAFEDEPSVEVVRILRELCGRLKGHPHFSPGHDQPLRDANGNEVGFLTIRENDD